MQIDFAILAKGRNPGFALPFYKNAADKIALRHRKWIIKNNANKMQTLREEETNPRQIKQLKVPKHFGLPQKVPQSNAGRKVIREPLYQSDYHKNQKSSSSKKRRKWINKQKSMKTKNYLIFKKMCDAIIFIIIIRGSLPSDPALL